MTEPTNNELKTYWADMPEGQQQLYQLCARITALHETMLDSKHPLTSSALMHHLMHEANELYDKLESLSDFASNDRAVRLLNIGARMKNQLSEFELEIQHFENGQIVILEIDSKIDVDQLLKKINENISQKGYRRISIQKTNLVRTDYIPIGDYVKVDVEKCKGKIRVEYLEEYNFGEFQKPYWDFRGNSLLDLAKVVDPELTEKDIQEKVESMATRRIGPIYSSVYVHQMRNNIDYGVTVDCKNQERAEDASRFFLETIKNNPRVGNV